MNSLRLRSLVFLALVPLVPAEAAAQRLTAVPYTTFSPTSSSLACMRDASPELFANVPVYLTLATQPRAASPAVDMLRLLVQDAAARVRTALGAAEGTVPVGDGKLGYQDLTLAMTIALRGDGVATITPREPFGSDVPGAPESRAMLLRAIRVAADSGGPYVWSATASDSVLADIGFTHQSVGRDGPFPLRIEFGVPVFSMRIPIEVPVTQLSGGAPTYPAEARQALIEAEVLTQFVVDVNGRVERESFRVVRVQTTNQLLANRFAAAVREVLPRLRFDPARLAGCPVRQLVQQPFIFALH